MLLRVARPQFLIASLAIFIIGAFWAILLGAPLSLSRLVLGYLIIVPAQLSVSYSNETFDVKVDQHSVPSLFSGGSGVLVRHAELRQPAKWVAIGLMVLAPFGLMVHPVLTFGVGIVGLSLWGVSAYLAFLYVKETRAKIDDLKAVLAKLPAA